MQGCRGCFRRVQGGLESLGAKKEKKKKTTPTLSDIQLNLHTNSQIPNRFAHANCLSYGISNQLGQAIH